MSAYAPGKCNIGPRNRLLRLAFGILLLSLSAVLFAYLVAVHAPKLYRFILVIPLFMGYTGILEGFFSFCVFHGFKGTQDLK